MEHPGVHSEFIIRWLHAHPSLKYNCLHDVQYVVPRCMGGVCVEMRSDRSGVRNGDPTTIGVDVILSSSSRAGRTSYKICSNRGTSYKNWVNCGTLCRSAKFAKSEKTPEQGRFLLMFKIWPRGQISASRRVSVGIDDHGSAGHRQGPNSRLH